MELKQVHKLIEAYFEGTTSLEEEKSLATYFSEEDIDPTLDAYLPYFATLAQERKQVSTKPFLSNSKKRKRWIRVAVVAASFLVGLLVFQQTQQPATPTPEELAFEEFKANMFMVSQHLNRGMEGVAYMETLNTTTSKYIKND